MNFYKCILLLLHIFYNLNLLTLITINFCFCNNQSQRVDAFLHTLSSKLDPPREHLASYSTWIIYHTIRIMIMYLLSGFELELYSPHEYQYIYW